MPGDKEMQNNLAVPGRHFRYEGVRRGVDLNTLEQLVLVDADVSDTSNIYTEPFLSEVSCVDDNTLTAVLKLALPGVGFAVRDAGVNGRREVHGVNTIPGCIELARQLLKEPCVSDNMRIDSHVIKAPIGNSLTIYAGESSGITAIRKERKRSDDRPLLECKVSRSDGVAVYIVGYDSPGQQIDRVFLGVPRATFYNQSQTGYPNTSDVSFEASAIIDDSWKRDLISGLLVGPICYALDLAQSFVLDALASNKGGFAVGRPFYVTKITDLRWHNANSLFAADVRIKATIGEMLSVPSSSGSEGDSYVWDIPIVVFSDSAEIKGSMRFVSTGSILQPKLLPAARK